MEERVNLRHIAQIKDMRKGIIETLRGVSKVMSHPTHRQTVIDLTTKLGPTREPDYDVLPAKPDGFVLKYAAIPKNGAGHLRTQCEFQVITMLITYFWVFCQTGDMQDFRSAMRYKGWLDRYAEDHKKYEVCGDERIGYWLCNTSILKDGEDPTLPQWLKDDGGETV